MADEDLLLRGVIAGTPREDQHFSDNFNRLLDQWPRRELFVASFGKLNDAEYVNRLFENAHLSVATSDRDALISSLVKGELNRDAVLSKILDDPRFIEAEKSRSFIVLHYFAYLHRNPDDPPDNSLKGLEFWVGDLERNHDPAKISHAFKVAGEYVDEKAGKR